MSESHLEDGYTSATARLDRALGRLEASVRSLHGRTRQIARIETEVHKLADERAKLAVALDRSEAKAKRLDESASEVSRRLVTAMETVRSAIGDGSADHR